MVVKFSLVMMPAVKSAPATMPIVFWAFTMLLAFFKVVEHTSVGMFHGKSFYEAIASSGDGPWRGTLCLIALLFVALIPFFGFTELRRLFGKDRLEGAFFRPRHLLNLPTSKA